ncbi:UNVERIFIED_CONTAM: hypothetical protein Slati_3707600 [Sesamum latifolium]|uniref:Uncharacterized protein n=1 Tax=Sesamum latifolium TaxID=2727402 RepID=A0AAW2U2W1_9LAMI
MTEGLGFVVTRASASRVRSSGILWGEGVQAKTSDFGTTLVTPFICLCENTYSPSSKLP